MKFLLMLLLMTTFIACEDDATDGDDTTVTYQCEEMTAENKVSGCKIGDWWNFDKLRCNSSEANCQK